MSQAGSASDRKPGHPVPVALADLIVGLKSVTFADEEDVDGKISSESEHNDEGNQVLESQQGDSHGDVAAAEGSQVCDEVAPSQQADPHAGVAAAEQSQVGIEFAASQQADPHVDVAAAEESQVGAEVVAIQQADPHGHGVAAEQIQVGTEVATSQQAESHGDGVAAEQSQVGTEVAESLQGSPPSFRADEAPSVSSSAIRPAATDSQVEDDISMDTLWSGFSGFADSFIATAQPQADEVQGEDQP